MSLVEVVRPITASDATWPPLFAGACGKDPVEVKDQAGFIVNALRLPYLNNAVRLLEQGVATKEGIDAAMKGGCGFPMGPSPSSTWSGSTPRSPSSMRSTTVPRPQLRRRAAARRLVTSGQLGRKTKKGFYDYDR